MLVVLFKAPLNDVFVDSIPKTVTGDKAMMMSAVHSQPMCKPSAKTDCDQALL